MICKQLVYRETHSTYLPENTSSYEILVSLLPLESHLLIE